MNTAERSELAESLAGTSDKKSRAYKSARRQVERWHPLKPGRRAQQPRAAVRPRIEQITEAVHMRFVGALVRLHVAWYKGQKGQWLPPNNWLPFTASEWRESEDDDGRLFELFLEKYNVPNPLDWLRDGEVTDRAVRPA